MSDESIPIGIRVTPAVAELLRTNNIDLFDVLATDTQLKGNISRGSSSSGDTGYTGARGDPLTILASAALVVAIGSAVERLVRVCTRKPAIITTRHSHARLGPDGSPIKDSNGNILYDITEVGEYVEPRVSDPFRLSAVAAAGRVELNVGLRETEDAGVPGPEAEKFQINPSKSAGGKPRARPSRDRTTPTNGNPETKGGGDKSKGRGRSK